MQAGWSATQLELNTSALIQLYEICYADYGLTVSRPSATASFLNVLARCVSDAMLFDTLRPPRSVLPSSGCRCCCSGLLLKLQTVNQWEWCWCRQRQQYLCHLVNYEPHVCTDD